MNSLIYQPLQTIARQVQPFCQRTKTHIMKLCFTYRICSFSSDAFLLYFSSSNIYLSVYTITYIYNIYTYSYINMSLHKYLTYFLNRLNQLSLRVFQLSHPSEDAQVSFITFCKNYCPEIFDLCKRSYNFVMIQVVQIHTIHTSGDCC